MEKTQVLNPGRVPGCNHNPGANLVKPNFEPFRTQVRLPKLNYKFTQTPHELGSIQH